MWVQRSRLLAMPDPIEPQQLSKWSTTLTVALTTARKRTSPLTLDEQAKVVWTDLYAQLSVEDES